MNFVNNLLSEAINVYRMFQAIWLEFVLCDHLLSSNISWWSSNLDIKPWWNEDYVELVFDRKITFIILCLLWDLVARRDCLYYIGLCVRFKRIHFNISDSGRKCSVWFKNFGLVTRSGYDGVKSGSLKFSHKFERKS